MWTWFCKTTARKACTPSENRAKPFGCCDVQTCCKATEALGQIGVNVYQEGTDENPVKIAKNAVKQALRGLNDVVIIDTAGRLQIDEELMVELEKIKEATNPSEILLVVDAMTGQDAANVAQTFNDRLDVTGIILSKLDSDTRGGAALSVKAVTGNL